MFLFRLKMYKFKKKEDAMKKTTYLLVLTAVLIITLTGCSSVSMQEPPEISVTIGGKEIEYVSAKNKWNGSVYDREDTFVTILKDQKEIPDIEIGNVAEIIFKSNPPDEFTVSDILINKSGGQKYPEKLTNKIPVQLNQGKYSFEIGLNLASMLSSQYNPEKRDLRGFRMIASWGENECEYAFVINTYSAKDL